MKRLLLALLLLAALTPQASAQVIRWTPPSGAALPANCTLGELFTKTGTGAGLYVCTGTNTWAVSPLGTLAFTGPYGSSPTDLGSSGAAKTVDWSTSNDQYLTLTGNVTLTFSNPTNGYRYALTLVQDATAGRTVTWPAAVWWPSGTAPTLGSGTHKVDLCTFQYWTALSAYMGACSTAY